MRFLLISFCLILVGCSSYSKKMGFEQEETQALEVLNPYFSNPEKDYVYKAQIKVKDNHFGGIFIVKKLGEAGHRVVFTTEMGNKIFDFSYEGELFKVNHIIEALNKKLLINMLRKDFEVLIKESPLKIDSFKSEKQTLIEADINKDTYYYFYNENVLDKVVFAKNGKEKINYNFLDKDLNHAKNIQILHQRFNLEINLKSI